MKNKLNTTVTFDFGLDEKEIVRIDFTPSEAKKKLSKIVVIDKSKKSSTELF